MLFSQFCQSFFTLPSHSVFHMSLHLRPASVPDGGNFMTYFLRNAIIALYNSIEKR